MFFIASLLLGIGTLLLQNNHNAITVYLATLNAINLCLWKPLRAILLEFKIEAFIY